MRKHNSDEGAKNRNLSWVLPVVLILMAAAAVVGIVAYSKDIVRNTRISAIEEYSQNMVIFTVFGEGFYKEENPTYLVSVQVNDENLKEIMGDFSSRGLSPELKSNEITVKEGFSIIELKSSNVSLIQSLLESEEFDVSYTVIRKNVSDSESNAYDEAYDKALEKAVKIASNSGLSWRIKEVIEQVSEYDKVTGVTKSRIQMSFVVDGNSLQQK